MKISLIFIFHMLIMCCALQNLSSQTGSQNELHHLMQIEGSEVYIKSYFDRYLNNYKPVYAYMILLPPMSCSRCEGLINPFISYLRKIDSLSKVILMVFHPKAKAVEKYLLLRNYQADLFTIMNDESFLDHFHISTGDLQVPYILKFKYATGDLIFSRSVLGMSMSEELVRKYHEAERNLTKYPQDQAIKSRKNEAIVMIQKSESLGSLPVLKPGKCIILEENEFHPLSSINYLHADEKSNYISFMDDLSYEIYVYRIRDTFAEFHTALVPSDEENKLFISDQISDTLYRYLKLSNILNSMYFSSCIIGDNIVISASLPRLFFEDTAMENLAYYNQMVYIYKDLSSGKILKWITPESIADSLIFTLDHLNTHYLLGKLLVPVRKGWPDAGTEILTPQDTINNPFIDTFYDKIPLIAVYTDKGDFIKYLGKLDNHYKMKKLGYYFNRNQIDEFDHNLWLSDAYGGKILQYGSDSDTITATHQIFKISDSVSPVDFTIDPLGYMLDYRNIYTRVILDFRVSENGIYCFVKDGNNYKCMHYTFDGQLLMNDYIPHQIGEMKFVTARMLRVESSVKLLGVYESPIRTAIMEFSL